MVCAHQAEPAASTQGECRVRGKMFCAQVRAGEISLISKLFQCIIAKNTAIKCDIVFTCTIFCILNGKSY